MRNNSKKKKLVKHDQTGGLSIVQRIVAVTIYIISFLTICKVFNGDWSFLTNSSSDYNLLFVSGALLLIFGTYIAEPYFTKPIDVITNTTAVVLALLSIKDPSSLVGYWELFYVSIILGIFSIIIIFFSQFPKIEKIQKIFFKIVTKLGQSKIIFSVIYLLTMVSYFGNKPIEFIFLLTFWIVFSTKYFVETFVIWSSEIFAFLFHNKEHSEIIGEAIGCENPFLYKIEIDYFKHRAKDTKKGELVYLSLEESKGAVGIIINEKQLLNKKWVTVYLLESENAPLKIDLKKQEFISGSRTIYSKDNAVYSLNLDDVDDSDSKKLVQDNYVYKNRGNFIGYITEGSDIHKVKFHSLLDSTNAKYKLLKEGTVIKTAIHGDDVLYQIIDGITYEEELEKHNVHGYMTGIAQKLGKYNKTNQELEVVKWLPNMYSPVLFDETKPLRKSKLAIGKLPETELEIILKDIDSLVTHNTAILGILGIGKSCLTFELIKQVIENTDVRVICIDITNEYKKKLLDYVETNLIKADDENIFNSINAKFEYIHEVGTTKNYEKSGNQSEYRASMQKDIVNFFFGQETIPESKTIDGEYRIRIFNPDYHKVSKGEKVGFNVITTELSQAEKTRIISEEIFKVMMKLGLKEDKNARMLLVLEEAHSLVPEWNSTANDGDKRAVNGTAKIILQGRKYGLGSLVVTQRTANISKSILNQCNTIFALRVFDDTGKNFLENYIGSSYSNTLPTLEERHAIVVGKGLKLKQPVIIRLNDKDDVIKKTEESTSKE